MTLKSRILGLVVIAGLLSACGSVHPGTAAVVNGERITMEQADLTARTLCIINLAGQEEGATYDNSQVRRQAVTSLIITEVAEQLAEERDLKVKISEESAAEVAAFREILEPKHRDDFDEVIGANLRFSAIAMELGKQSQPEIDDPNALMELGMGEISAAMSDLEVEIDPRFGLSPTGEQIADSGSLSVQGMNFEAPAPDERAVALHCSSV